jgi:hypothetical protein
MTVHGKEHLVTVTGSLRRYTGSVREFPTARLATRSMTHTADALRDGTARFSAPSMPCGYQSALALSPRACT